MNNAIFLDRDGTLIEDAGYLSDPSQVRVYDFTIKALRLLQPYYKFFIVTNQAGIAKGIVTKEQVDTINDHVVRELSLSGIIIEQVYCCPHKTEDNCNCKKPSPYFLKLAERDFGIDITRSFMIGDHPADVLCAKNAGAQGIYILTGHGEKHAGEVEPGFTVKRDLLEAAEYILANHAT